MTEYKKVMLISPDSVKGYGLVNNNVDDGVLGSSIRVCQNIYLTDMLGTAFVEHLQELVYNSIKGEGPSIDDDDNAMYKVLLDDYVKDFLAYKTASEVTTRISLKIRNAGVVQNSETNIQPSSLNDIIYLKGQLETYVCQIQDRMVDFLKAHKDAFVELDNNCGCNDSRLGKRYGNIGLWLG